ncbi:MAG: hypothetical protein WCI47_00460 [bacterium]
MNQASAKSVKKPLAGSLSRALTKYPKLFRPIMVATFIPVFMVGVLRWLTDDYTGDQYAVLIILIAIFSSFAATRIAVAGWDWKNVRLMAFYNGVMMRYLSAIGLMASLLILNTPLIGGILLTGLVVVSEVSKWLILPSLLLLAAGIVITIRSSLALYALADDMELSVLQALQISNRLTKRLFWPYAWRFGLVGGLVLLGSIGLVTVGGFISSSIQSTQLQLIIDLAGGWLVTPFLLFIIASLYASMVEAYE